MNSSIPHNLHADLEMVLAHIIQGFIKFMKEQGLSTPQINALMYIYHAGECQVSDIGVLADASNAAASQLVERLVQQDLVQRKEDPADRRTKLLTLTEKGRELIRGGVPSNQFLMDVMASLTPDQRQTVHAAFGILAQAAHHIQNSNIQKDGNHA